MLRKRKSMVGRRTAAAGLVCCLLVGQGAVARAATAGAEPTPYAELPSAGQLSADVSALGASAVLSQRLAPNPALFERLLQQVQTGSADWLELAARLAPAADGGNSEGLAGAVSIALARQPEKVLELLDPVAAKPSFTVANVCSGRTAFFEQPEREQQWREQAARSVAAVRGAALRATRDACLAAIPK